LRLAETRDDRRLGIRLFVQAEPLQERRRGNLELEIVRGAREVEDAHALVVDLVVGRTKDSVDSRLDVASRANAEDVGGLRCSRSTVVQRQRRGWRTAEKAHIDQKAIRKVGSVLPLALGRENLQPLNDLRKQNGDESEVSGRGKRRESQWSSSSCRTCSRLGAELVRRDGEAQSREGGRWQASDKPQQSPELIPRRGVSTTTYVWPLR
jgi:hypothetical protein